MRKRGGKKMFGLGIVSALIALSISGIIGAFCFPYAINTWLVFFGKTASVLWWHGFLLGYVPWIGQASLPLAAVTWILMLILV
jgi:hypothetical protein